MHHEEHDHEYMHAHNIPHDHDHHHDHDHDHCDSHDCGHCGGCADPMAELQAVMKYMVGHNAAHARELAQLAENLQKMGNETAYNQVMAAVSDFEKGNMRLSAVLASLQ